MLYSAVRFPYKFNLRDFEVEGHFLLEARKKSRLQGCECIFSGSPIVQIVAFWLLFDVVLIVPPAAWSSSSAAHIFCTGDRRLRNRFRIRAAAGSAIADSRSVAFQYACVWHQRAPGRITKCRTIRMLWVVRPTLSLNQIPRVGKRISLYGMSVKMPRDVAQRYGNRV
jgi:hypothetical protein